MASGGRRTALLCAAWILAATTGSAQEPMSVEDIINSLSNSAPPSASAQEVIDALENRIAVVPLEEQDPDTDATPPETAATAPPPPQQPVAADPVKQLPTLNFAILFDTNSDAINPNSYPQLVNMAAAFASPAFQGRKLLIAGHTDAKGSDQHNLGLSQRRANSVKTFLTALQPTVSERLVAMGFGESQLKNTADPLAAENRRVQVVNLGQ